MKRAEQLDDFEIHMLAWSKFRRELAETAIGVIERIRGIPARRRLLVSFEWHAWREGRDWQVLYAREPKQRRRKWTPIVTSSEGTGLW